MPYDFVEDAVRISKDYKAYPMAEYDPDDDKTTIFVVIEDIRTGDEESIQEIKSFRGEDYYVEFSENDFKEGGLLAPGTPLAKKFDSAIKRWKKDHGEGALEPDDINTACPPGYTYVRGYHKKDGTYVTGHCKRI